MHTFNTSETEISTSYLIGIPGMARANIWVPIPICFMYLVAILGNCTILIFIKSKPSLHEPMYYFLSMLALSDLGLSLSSLPTIILVQCSRNFPQCLLCPKIFIHEFSVIESSILLITSFDHFIAIATLRDTPPS